MSTVISKVYNLVQFCELLRDLKYSIRSTEEIVEDVISGIPTLIADANDTPFNVIFTHDARFMVASKS